MVSKYISLVHWTAALVWMQSGRKQTIVLKLDIRGGLAVYVQAAVVMVGCTEIGVGWSSHWAQQPNSSARWTPSGGLSRWTSVTMETLVGPGLHWGQLQDCKPGWSDLLKNNSVCPQSTVTYSMRCIAGCTMNDLNWGIVTRKQEYVENVL